MKYISHIAFLSILSIVLITGSEDPKIITDDRYVLKFERSIIRRNSDPSLEGIVRDINKYTAIVNAIIQNAQESKRGTYVTV